MILVSDCHTLNLWLFMLSLIRIGQVVRLTKSLMLILLCFLGPLEAAYYCPLIDQAKYKALANIATEIAWVQSLLGELGLQQPSGSLFWCDNLRVTYLCNNLVFHARTKHVEINYHFVREQVASGNLKVNFLST